MADTNDNKKIPVSAVNISYRLKQLRKESNFTQQQMADMLDISLTHYSNLERGQRNCSLEMFIKICQIFSLPGNDLLRDYLPMPAPASSVLLKEDFSVLPLEFQNMITENVEQFITLMEQYESRIKNSTP